MTLTCGNKALVRTMLSDEHYKIRSVYVKDSEAPMEEMLSSIKKVEVSEDEPEPSWCNWSYAIWLEKQLLEVTAKADDMKTELSRLYQEYDL